MTCGGGGDGTGAGGGPGGGLGGSWDFGRRFFCFFFGFFGLTLFGAGLAGRGSEGNCPAGRRWASCGAGAGSGGAPNGSE